MAQPQNLASRNADDDSQLPMVKVDQEHVDNGVQCTTCLETFELDEDVAKLDCQHIFHRDCIQPWLQSNDNCPVCRAKVEWRRDFAEQMRPTINAAAFTRILQYMENVEQHRAQLRQTMENFFHS